MIQKLSFLLPLLFCSALTLADSQPGKILYVGGIGINPSQDPKILADWYTRFGFDLTQAPDGGFYGQFDTASGTFYFAVHPKSDSAAKKSSASVSFNFAVENFDGTLSALKSKGIVPLAPPSPSPIGRFADFLDPDGNQVSIWGK